MANQRDLIYEYDNTKVDIGIKKSNRVKTRSWVKSRINKKCTKKDGQQLDRPIEVRWLWYWWVTR